MKKFLLIIFVLLVAACGTSSPKTGPAPNDSDTAADFGVDTSEDAENDGSMEGHDVGVDTVIDRSPDQPRTSLFDPSTLPECLYDSSFEEGDPQPYEHLVLEGRGDDLTFVLALCLVADGAGHSGIFRADHVELTWADERQVFTTDDIDYVNTHHNWADSLVVDKGDLKLTWRTEYQGGQVNQIFHWVTADFGDRSLPEALIDVTCERCGNYTFVLRD